MTDSMRLFLASQLDDARRLRLHQDLLRFGIPGAYFAFVGAAAGQLTTGGPLIYGIATLVGFGVYLAAIVEHFYYVAFRNWAYQLEIVLLSGSDDDYRKVATFTAAMNSHEAIKSPNLSHATMLVVFFAVAVSVGVFSACLVGALFHTGNVVLRWVVVLATTCALMSIYKYWHSFYKRVLKGVLKRFDTR